MSGVRIPWLLLGESVLEFDGSLQELGGREPAQIGGDFIGAVLELVFKPPPPAWRSEVVRELSLRYQ